MDAPTTWSGWVIVTLLPVVVIGAIIATIDGWRRRRGAASMVEGREALSSEAFAREHFRGSELEARIAALARDALARRFRRPLDGLRPDDRLWEDLALDVAADPEIHWELAEQLGRPLGEGEDIWGFVHEIVTFRDLVRATAALHARDRVSE